MEESLPYVASPGKIPELFAKIREAAVPPKFNRDFLTTMLDLKSSNFVAMIPLLKKLGFLDEGNTPTQEYKDYRDNSLSSVIMARCIKKAYTKLFGASEYAYRLNRKDLNGKVKTLTGLPDGSTSLEKIVGTFLQLCSLANFEGESALQIRPVTSAESKDEEKPLAPKSGATPRLGISYTINLNLPATTEIAVFNAIFKSLKEHLLQ